MQMTQVESQHRIEKDVSSDEELLNPQVKELLIHQNRRKVDS